MSFSPAQIQDIRQRADLVSVIGRVVPLQKKGRRFVGLCPFHGEKTPSFSVSSEKGFYYCFGCHAGGDVFSFVMRHGGLEFQEAVRKLAQDVGVQVEALSPQEERRRREVTALARANAYALAFFEHALWDMGGNAARAYLSERGVPEDVAKTWRLGFGGGRGALHEYLRAKQVRIDLAQRAGYVTEDGKRGVFEGRVIFPILDAQGQVLGFGGRRMLEDKGPKYINSRESAVFEKRRLLFGWPHAEEAIRRGRTLTLVEGYLDVLACHRAQVTTAVAALGTAFTPEHAQALKRLAEDAVLAFDGDAAGQRATWAACEQLFAMGVKVRVAALPAGDDPDSLVRKQGAAALTRCIEVAQPAVEHFMAALLVPGLNIEQRATRADKLTGLIAQLPSGLERDLYLARLAEKVGVSVERLQQHVRRPPAKRAAKKGSEVRPVEETIGPDAFERRVLAELLLYPSLRPELAKLCELASDPMRMLLADLAQSPEPVADVLRRHVPAPEAILPVALADREPEQQTDALAKQTFDDVLSRFAERHLDRAKQALLDELRAAEENGEDTEALVRKIQTLTRRRRDLKAPRG